jgi:hypothetical protein
MSRNLRIFVLAVAVLFILATVGKHVLNELNDGLYAQYNGPQSISVEDARNKGLLLSVYKIEPAKLANEGYQYTVDQAWTETAYRPCHFLIWFSYSQKADWSYLCIRPSTHWYQENFIYNLQPDFDPPFELEGFGVKNHGMASTSGNDSPELHYQQVPNDLKEFTATVSVYTYGKGKDVTVGTARFTAIE